MLAGLAAHPLVRRYQRFWLDTQVAPEVLAAFRFLFFGVLAVDMWLQIEHAPRYGAGGFNVSHLPALDSYLPILTRPVVTALFLIQAWLAGLIAFGGGGRAALIALTSLYGVTYFGSQLDSYQHHYLMFLVLFLSCFLGWGPDDRGGWPVRLILVQISIVYFFAAMAKLEPLWWDGVVMAKQVSSEWAQVVIERLGGFSRVAKLVILTELGLAFAIHVRRLRPFAAPIGILFHVGIEASGFHIGLFSYFMIALYLLVLPERPVVSAVSWLRRIPRPAIPLVSRFAPLSRWVLRAAAILLGAGLLLLVPLGAPAAWTAAVVLVLAVAALLVLGNDRRDVAALAHLVACALIAFLSRPAVTDVARDYYKFWGGSSRRLGDLATATAAYQRVVEIAPDYAQGHVSLGNLYRRTGQIDRALAEAARAQALAPGDYRGYLLEAMLRDVAGEGEAALKAAERVLDLEPGDRDARSIAVRWRKRLGLPPLEPPGRRPQEAPDEENE